MIGRLLAVLIFASSIAPVAAQQGLVSDLSERRIDIRTQFAGADIIVFGAVGRASGLELDEAFDVIAVVRGPTRPVVVRRKERLLGVWVNHDAVRFETALGYFAVAATQSLQEIADEDQLTIHQIGLDHLMLSPATAGGLSPSEIGAFRAGLIRERSAAALFQTAITPIEVRGNTLFRTSVRLPAKAPVGTYTVDLYLFSQGRLVAQARQNLEVDKSGIERWIYTVAQQRPFLYGLTAVVVALVAGWLGGFIYRKG